MSDPSHYPDSDDESVAGADPGAGAGRRARSKLVVIGLIVLLGLFVGLHIAGVLGPRH